jgi:hypothetical protein
MASALLLAATASALLAQEKTPPSRPRPAPRITGVLIDTDGSRRLTLQYHDNAKFGIFTGTTQSSCMLPAGPKLGESKPLGFSGLPIGTAMTVFYVRHEQAAKPGSPQGNMILAVRFDGVRHASTLPAGVVIPCFKGSGGASMPRGLSPH